MDCFLQRQHLEDSSESCLFAASCCFVECGWCSFELQRVAVHLLQPWHAVPRLARRGFSGLRPSGCLLSYSSGCIAVSSCFMSGNCNFAGVIETGCLLGCCSVAAAWFLDLRVAPEIAEVAQQMS